MNDAAIQALVDANPGQATLEEYRLFSDVLCTRAPCNLLVFGAGRDSRLWLDANAGGTTTFLEDEQEWADSARGDLPGIQVRDVRYRGRRFMWPLLRHLSHLLKMRLPGDVEATGWNVILVDAPRGTRWYRRGRMMSVYTAALLGRRASADVFVHDCHRRVERESSDQFLGDEHFVTQVGTMRHYRLP